MASIASKKLSSHSSSKIPAPRHPGIEETSDPASRKQCKQHPSASLSGKDGLPKSRLSSSGAIAPSHNGEIGTGGCCSTEPKSSEACMNQVQITQCHNWLAQQHLTNPLAKYGNLREPPDHHSEHANPRPTPLCTIAQNVEPSSLGCAAEMRPEERQQRIQEDLADIGAWIC